MSLLLGIPGIAALVGYIYFATPSTAVPTKLSRPLFALLSGINPLLLLGVACLLGAYAAPRAGLQSLLVDGEASDDGVWRRLRGQVVLAAGSASSEASR
ncbi:hypothetical protein ACFQL4_02855 [Halosimplex aquaticum]